MQRCAHLKLALHWNICSTQAFAIHVVHSTSFDAAAMINFGFGERNSGLSTCVKEAQMCVQTQRLQFEFLNGKKRGVVRTAHTLLINNCGILVHLQHPARCPNRFLDPPSVNVY